MWYVSWSEGRSAQNACTWKHTAVFRTFGRERDYVGIL
jgi:hypothetical protein